MLKKIFIFLSLFIFSNIQAQAFEDYLIISDSKLVDIRIDNNKIIDVYPLITVMNEKNILVLGEAGYGKTYESITLVQKACSNENTRNLIPVFLPLQALT